MTFGEETEIFNRMYKAIGLLVEIFAEQAGISQKQAKGMMFSAFIIDLIEVIDNY